MKILDKLHSISDVRSLSSKNLEALAAELRTYLQNVTSTKPAHIKSSLGVTELTIALHYVFDTPFDILIWDVGHQAYIHKILTDRREDFSTNRKLGGISGFTKRSESPFDPFGAGHSSTSISAAVGFATSAKLKGIDRQHIAVIGDGAFTGGESFEALNYLGQEQLNVLIVLNDNQSSIDTNVGALAQKNRYEALCESLDITYCGEVNAHNLQGLLSKFEEIKGIKTPKLVKVNSHKGKGYQDLSVEKSNNKEASKTFQEVFSEALIAEAHSCKDIVAITPAMLSGSGLHMFQKVFPQRTFDVGIAEQHAVTFAAALAADGQKAVCHLYATFSQRAYDQIIHDVALQNLAVVFCLDRAGLVGEDGPTHHGNFDVNFLNAIPNLVISAPMDGASLRGLLHEGIQSDKPFVIRYPKGKAYDDSEIVELPIGKLRLLKKGSKRAYISFGILGQEFKKALSNSMYSHYDLVYLKPIDEAAVKNIFNSYEEVISIEENAASGGLGEKLTSLKEKWDSNIKLRSYSLPDTFIEHGTREELLRIVGLDAQSIIEKEGLD